MLTHPLIIIQSYHLSVSLQSLPPPPAASDIVMIRSHDNRWYSTLLFRADPLMIQHCSIVFDLLLLVKFATWFVLVFRKKCGSQGCTLLYFYVSIVFFRKTIWSMQSFFQTEKIFVRRFNKLWKITDTWIAFNYSLIQAQKHSGVMVKSFQAIWVQSPGQSPFFGGILILFNAYKIEYEKKTRI